MTDNNDRIVLVPIWMLSLESGPKSIMLVKVGMRLTEINCSSNKFVKYLARPIMQACN